MLSWLKPSQKTEKDVEQPAARDADAPPVDSTSNIDRDLAGSKRVVSVTQVATSTTPNSEAAQSKKNPFTDTPAVSAAIPSAWEPKRRAQTSAQSQPHDAVVAERMDQGVSAPLQSADTLPTAPSEAPGSVMPELDRLFDPHTGATLGTFAPPQMANGQAREELWAHLSRIRALQAEIANLHVCTNLCSVSGPLNVDRLPWKV